ncbi:MAG TPA: galactosyldiacylglycerol synthase [Opitutaceae bacterium]|nr:galactosyldiacylglycerol synthase [Opitutaceae bacterium]
MSRAALLLTAGFGEGHNAAARALAAAVDERHGPDAARVVDIFALARPRLNAGSRRAYLSLINRAPGLWRHAYGWLDRSARAPGLFRWMRCETSALGELIRRERPAVLLSTYPIYAYLLADLARRGFGDLPPHANVVTDSISINSLWWRAPCSDWFVPNEDSATVLLAGGVPPARIRTLGFPVNPYFADQLGRLAPPLLTEARPRVLYIINSRTRAAAETAHRLLAEQAWDVTCTVGRNDQLRSELLAAAARRTRPAEILGWTHEIPRLLLTHHVVVSKAGGATTQEAIAAHCPMLVNQIVPGQEEGNYELLRRHGIGAFVPTPDAVIATLRAAFAEDGREWHRWREALARLARPNAARDIVAAVLPTPLASASPASLSA